MQYPVRYQQITSKMTALPFSSKPFKFQTILLFGIAIILLNLFLKALFITSIPPILTNDETYYATEAQAILASGSDVTGRWRPWDLAPANPIYAELTGLTYSPGFVIFPKDTQLAMKVVPIVFGSILPVLLALITYRLFQRKIFFVVTALLATVNPWIFQFSRMSFDSFASVFFYCLGIVGMMYLKGWKILLVFIPFFLGFYQYQGHKPLLVPLVVITSAYVLLQDGHLSFTTFKLPKITWPKFLPHLVLLLACIMLTVVYLIRLPHLSSSVRISEFAVNQQALTDQVNMDRRLSFANKASSLFENKRLVLVQQLSRRFFASFDPTWLFQHGNDQVDTFAVTQFGFLYAIDAVLIVIAVVWLWADQKRWLPALFLSAFVIVGALPNVLKNEQLWLTFRGSFMILGLLLLAAVGCTFLLLQKRRVLTALVILIYACSVIPFFYQYFFRYPILTTKDSFFYNRVVANYIQRQPDKKFVIYGGKTLFDGIIAYDHLITPATLPALHAAYLQKNYKIANVRIADGCFDQQWAATQSGTVVMVGSLVVPCANAEKTPTATTSAQLQPISLSSVIDSGGMFAIYHDNFCSQKSLGHYVDITKNLFAVEKLSNQDFCDSFFTR